MKELFYSIGCGLAIGAICMALTLLNECRHVQVSANADEIVRVEEE